MGQRLFKSSSDADSRSIYKEKTIFTSTTTCSLHHNHQQHHHHHHHNHHSSNSNNNKILRFYLISDFGDSNEEVNNIAKAMNHYATSLHSPPDFIIGLGDNFYPMGVEDIHDLQFTTTWRNVFLKNYPALRVPWRMILGNHDYMGNPAAQVEYHYSDIYNHDHLWYMPSNSYQYSYKIEKRRQTSSPPPQQPQPQPHSQSQPPQPDQEETSTMSTVASSSSSSSPSSSPVFSTSLMNGDKDEDITIDFFALDTNACQGHVVRDYPKSLNILKKTLENLQLNLASSKANWKLVFGHHPMYTQGLGHSIPSDFLRESYKQYIYNQFHPGFGLESLLVNQKIDGYFAGHEHVFQYHHAKGLHHFGCGAGGGDMRPETDGCYGGINPYFKMNWKAKGDQYGFVCVEILSKNEMKVKYLDEKCNILKEVNLWKK